MDYPLEGSKHEDVYYSIFDSYIKEFGLTEEAKSDIRKRQHALKLFIRFFEKKDFLAKAQAEIILAELEKDGQGRSVEFHEQVTLVSKYMGYRVDPKKTSQFEFLGAIKTMSNGGK